ncbi:VWA domain-containing protein [Helicobacter himalayensis]|uniref:VWA domain-containing protein n=1 Tax=Helicobacter himalayensis TaxID=1591088 RepID=UPI003D6EE5AF
MIFNAPLAFLVILPFAVLFLFARFVPKLVANAQMMRAKKSVKFVECLKILGTLCLICALAEPNIILSEFSFPKMQSQIALVLDTSHSMDMNDFGDINDFEDPKTLHNQSTQSPNRLEVLKRVSKKFIAKNPYDSILLVPFGEYSLMLNPLSSDRAYLSALIDSLSLGMAGGKTAINDALARTIFALSVPTHPNAQKSIILLTDGFDTDSKMKTSELLNLALEKNVRIFTISIGEGADLTSLEYIAKTSGGRAYLATDSKSLDSIFDAIGEIIPHSVVVPYSYSLQIFFIMLGIVLLLVYWWLKYGFVSGILGIFASVKNFFLHKNLKTFLDFRIYSFNLYRLARVNRTSPPLRAHTPRFLETLRFVDSATWFGDFRIFAFLAFICFCIACAFALTQSNLPKNSNAVFVLDVSKSMLAKDLYPTRLKFATTKLAKILKNHKLCSSIIIFSQSAYLLSPFSCDFSTQALLLENLSLPYGEHLEFDLNALDNGASNVDLALEMAKFYGEKIVLLSDGDFATPKGLNSTQGALLWLFASMRGDVIEFENTLIKDSQNKVVVSAPKDFALSGYKAHLWERVQASLDESDESAILTFLKNTQDFSFLYKNTYSLLFLSLGLFALFIAFWRAKL